MILRVPCCASATSAHQPSLDHNDRCKQMNSVHDLLADDPGFETVLPATPPLQVLMPGDRRPDVEAVNAQMRVRLRDLRALPPEASPERKDTLRDIGKKTLSVDAQSAKCPARLRDLRALPPDGSPNLKITDASSHASPAGPSAAPLLGSDADLCLPNQVEIDAGEGVQSSPGRCRRGGRRNTGTSRALARWAGAAGEPRVSPVGEERPRRRATAQAWWVQAPCGVSVQPARPWPWRAYRRSGRFMMLTGAHQPPEFLLREIAKHTPAESVLRQPETAAGHANAAREEAKTESRSAKPCDPEQRPPPALCTRTHPVTVKQLNAGLYGIFFFDPQASQCCNTARASTGWVSYRMHACQDCRRRAQKEVSE
jgi:hypothetical protein